ncbi:uncharacterized protein F4822DRAFT_433470 [Hypoxylon trugodes]|uniref:uncharacterized protein n=1 Tax=Hypoxylon trugodes TaxID=326681 RepID=UPI00218F17F7|nr:uncharacterized protein F4822DRAFT_433470 [Hypoxylon trugodes]KAI1384934.1 hypothetical protein F4822DRAFT_433470 [Hypoxylon trugodes]
MSLPLALSFEPEDEALAKARKKNRLAQRKHRQKKKSLSNAASEQSQDPPEMIQGWPHMVAIEGDSLRNYGRNNEEVFGNYGRIPPEAGSDHELYITSPGTDVSQDLSIRAMDVSGPWSFPREIGTLMSPSILSTVSLSYEDEIQLLSRDGRIASSNNSILPGYNHDCVSQAPFSSAHGSVSPDTNCATPISPEKATSLRMGHKGQAKDRHNSIASQDSSRGSDRSDVPHWHSQAISAVSNAGANQAGDFLTSTTYAPMDSRLTASEDHIFQAANIMRAESFRHSPQEDEALRLEKVLDAIDEAGFDSVDSMATAYYTSVFPPESPLHSAQALSKRRHLRKLLVALHESSKRWDAQESHNFHEGVMRSAEDILIDEMKSLDLVSTKGADDDKFLGKLDSISAREDHEATKEHRRVFKQYAPETWSLLTELGNAMGLRPAQNVQLVSSFLSTLVRK